LKYFSISAGSVTKALREWTEFLIGLKYAKGFLQGPSVKTEQKPVTMGVRTTQRTLPPERTPLQNGNNEQSQYRKVPRNR
jgi:hypothetical protein